MKSTALPPRWLVPIALVCALLAGCEFGQPSNNPPTASVSGPDNTPIEVTAAAEAPADDAQAQEAKAEEATEASSDEKNETSPVARNEAKVSQHKSAGYNTSKEASDKPKFDPIVENGKFFEGWPKPKLALVISGRQDGYLEPCGCAGLENQKGGFNRRHALFNQLKDKGWPVAAVDVGGYVRRFGRQAEIQFGITAEALKIMGYSAAAFGPADLRLSAGEVVAVVAAAKPEDSLFVSANVNLFGVLPKTRIVEAGGMKLGITSVLGKEFQQQVNNSEIEIQPAEEAIQAVVGELQDCDVKILLANAPIAECRELAKKFPQFNLVVSGDDIDIPAAQPEELNDGKTRLVEVGHKGMYVVVAGFYDDPRQPMRYQRVALDSRFPDTKEMKRLMANYQDQLEQLGWAGLGLKPVTHPRAQGGNKQAGQFVGAQSCKECHPTAYGVWSKTRHAHATESLTRLDPPRHHDPECVSCHTTGWNPQEFFPYVGGFDSLEKTPLLAGNSCENCHGPGGAHMAAEAGRNTAKRDAERDAMKLTVALAKDNVCAKCHDPDNSPEFSKPGNFDLRYWPKVEHKGKK